MWVPVGSNELIFLHNNSASNLWISFHIFQVPGLYNIFFFVNIIYNKIVCYVLEQLLSPVLRRGISNKF